MKYESGQVFWDNQKIETWTYNLGRMVEATNNIDTERKLQSKTIRIYEYLNHLTWNWDCCYAKVPKHQSHTLGIFTCMSENHGWSGRYFIQNMYKITVLLMKILINITLEHFVYNLKFLEYPTLYLAGTKHSWWCSSLST